MCGREPSQPHSQQIFPKTERPIAERLRRHVCSSAGTGLCAMRGESDATGEKRGSPSPGFRRCGGGAERKQRRRGRTNKGVYGLPDGIDVRHFVRKKLDQIKNGSNP